MVKKMIEGIDGKILTSVVVSMLAAFVGDAQASTISIATGYSQAGPQASADAYKSVVEAAVAAPVPAGYGTASPAVFENISNHGLFAGPLNDIAFAFTINFGVSAAQAGTWELRAGIDFGRGGAFFLDGAALGFNSNDMWWSGSYADPSQSFDYTALLGAGEHVLNIYGLEGCCDGGQQVQFREPGSAEFTTFSAVDGLAAIPEPATFALFGISLLGCGVVRRLRR